MSSGIRIAEKGDLPNILNRLRHKGVRNAWAIQDLTVWPDRSKFYYLESGDKFSYLLISGHPASHGHPTLIADGDPDAVVLLLKNSGISAPFVIRETPAHLLTAMKALYSDSKAYLEQRMDVTKETFKPKHKGLARSLNANDAESLAQFFGAPPQAAGRFKGW